MGLCIATGTGNPCCPGERINERPEKDQTVAAVPTGVIQVSASQHERVDAEQVDGYVLG